jgi:hypothetical protein
VSSSRSSKLRSDVVRGAAILAALGVAAFSCTRTTELFPSLTAACTPPGPIIHLGGTNDTSCAGAIAAGLGRYALCTCNDLVLTSKLDVSAPSGSGGMPGVGPPPHGVPPAPSFAAPVGSDGNIQVPGMARVAGSLVAAGTGGVVLDSGGFIGGNVHSAGSLMGSALMDLVVAGDAYVVGPAVDGRINIQGALHAPATTVLAPEAQAGAVVQEAVTVDSPCQCAAGPVFDIAGAVAAREEKNADDALSFPISLLGDLASNQTLDWSCGEYYLPSLQTEDGVTLEFRVHGHVGIFVAGDVQLGGNFVVRLDPDAELDLVVAGSVYTTGRVFGSPGSPVRTRLWVGSTTVSLPDQIQFGAAVYAPSAVFSAGVGLTFAGTLFAGTLSVAGAVHIIYDPTATAAGQSCGGSTPQPVE